MAEALVLPSSSSSSSEDDASNNDMLPSSFLVPPPSSSSSSSLGVVIKADETKMKEKAPKHALKKATTSSKNPITPKIKKRPKMFPFQSFSSIQLEITKSLKDRAVKNDEEDAIVLQSIYVAFTAASYAVLRALYRANKRGEVDDDETSTLPDLASILQTAILQDKIPLVKDEQEEMKEEMKKEMKEEMKETTENDKSTSISGKKLTSVKSQTESDSSTSNSDDSSAPISALSTKRKKKDKLEKQQEKMHAIVATTPTTVKYTSIEQQPKTLDNEDDDQEDAALDPRTLMTRAILCSTATIALTAITPPPPTPPDTTTTVPNKLQIDPLDIPQNKKNNLNKLNMGAVIMQSSALGKRILSHVSMTSSKAKRRHLFITDGLSWNHPSTSCPFPRSPLTTSHNSILAIPNPFLWSSESPKTADTTTNTNGFSLEDRHTMSTLAIQHLQNDRVIIPTHNTNDEEEEDNGGTIWNTICKPRFLQILNCNQANNTTTTTTTTTAVVNDEDEDERTSTCGHVIYHDADWNGRVHRIADILRTLAVSSNTNNYGPHLIVCTSDQIPSWEMAFAGLGCFVSSASSALLRAVSYTGTKRQRRYILPYLKATCLGSTAIANLCTSTYVSDAPYHVVLTSYKIFFQDFIPLCQIPWQVVVLDDGMSWLGTAHNDPNGKIGRAWDAVWSKSDGWAGLAGLPPYFGGRGDIWSLFSKNDEEEENDLVLDETESIVSDDEDSMSSYDSVDAFRTTRSSIMRTSAKYAKALAGSTYLLGLAARHRIITCSNLSAAYKGTIYPAPVPSLIQFVCPQYMDTTREEWDRSRISTCVKSIRHIRSLVARAVIVHPASSSMEAQVAAQNQVQLAWDAMEGVTPFSEVLDNGGFADSSSDVLNASTEILVSSGKITPSRRFATAWLSPAMRHEIASMCSLDPILGAVFHASESTGYVCEEIVSTGTTAGTAGNIYGCAVRCGRIFTNEQGLRQHLAAMHAPTGTWLCRSCGGDCGTSLARTFHERYCSLAATSGGTSGATPTVGQGASNIRHPGVGKQGSVTGNVSNLVEETVDKDGALLVPTYRGVWVNTEGKYFVKIAGKAIMTDFDNQENEASSLQLFLSAEDAAMKYDMIAKKDSENNAELNFKEDGSRIIYEDSGTITNVSRNLDALGGGAISVVPALSVINIKDLPENVKPLLRDPRQASRAGANSKRFIYKYRGVCRQARKGHDRWQSQISFSGTNHYLGTFDSEWDAAAIYAWAHLILYGEEATKKAEKEGEDAVAIWEQEQKDIAEGKLVEKEKPNKKIQPMVKKAGTGIKAETKPKTPGRKKKDPDASPSNKIKASQKLQAAGPKGGFAMLIGINSADFNWSSDFFISMCEDSINSLTAMASILKAQFGPEGANSSFKEIIGSMPVTLGSKGGSKERGTFVDCDVRGPIRTCSPCAAKIEYFGNAFQLRCCNEDDVVTLNAIQVTKSMGSLQIKSGDVCSVGARVFIFALPLT